MNVIFIGSVYSLIHKIFKDSKEPLFGGSERIIHLRPFSIKTVHTILNDNGIDNVKTLFDYTNLLYIGSIPQHLSGTYEQNNLVT